MNLLYTLQLIAMQVDPNTGTAKAMQGAKARALDPHYYDMVFPVIALVLVIIVPSCVALWVAYKTITDTELVDGDA